MRIVLLLTLTALLTTPASAGVIACTPALEAEEVCVAGQYVVSLIVGDLADLERLIAAEAERINYQATIPCRAERAVEDSGILRAAGVGEGACAAELVGTEVANPQPPGEAVSNELATTLSSRIRDREHQESREAVAAPAAPDIRPGKGQS